LKIVIDITPLQTASKLRGIGNYTKNYVTSIISNSVGNEIILLINELLPLPKEYLASIKPKYSYVHTCYWRPLEGVFFGADSKIETIRAKREISREIYAETIRRIDADILLICSGFEGYQDNAIYTTRLNKKETKVYIIVYDAIPFKEAHEYFLQNKNYSLHLEDNLGPLMNADTLIAISETTAAEFSTLFGDKRPSFLVSKGGVSDNENEREILNSKLESPARVSILMIANSEPQKNISFVLDCLANTTDSKLSNVEMIIVGRLSSGFRRKHKKALSKLSKTQRLREVGHIDEVEKRNLISNVNVLVLPSIQEGLNLVLMEGLLHNVPILVSDITIHREVLRGLSVPFFNVHSQEDFLTKLKQSIDEPNEFKITESEYRHFAQEFSYSKSAQKFLKQIHYVSSVVSREEENDPIHRSRVAVVSPLPPSPTGIADYTQEQIKLLLRDLNYEVDVFQELTNLEDQDLDVLRKLNLSDFKQTYLDYDHIFYHLGNSHFHEYMLNLLRDYPGIVFLHDVDLTGWFTLHEDAHPLEARYLNSVRSEHGSIIAAEILTQKREPESIRVLGFEYIKNSPAIVVHNEEAFQIINTFLPNVSEKVHKIPLVKEANSKLKSGSDLRSSLGIAESAIVIATFGMMAETKCDLEIIKTFSSFIATSETAVVMIFVGQIEGGSYGTKILELARRHENIRFTNHVSKEIYVNYLEITDIAIQLRRKSKGETSGALLDVLGQGIPTIANMHGSVGTDLFPAVYQIPDQFTLSDLENALSDLIKNSEKRKQLSKAALHFLHTYNSPKIISEKLEALMMDSEVKKNSANARFPHKVLRKCSNALIELSDLEIIDLGKSIRRIQVTPRRIQRVFIDITASFSSQKVTGIERTVKELIENLMRDYSHLIEVIPIRIVKSGKHSYRTCMNWGNDQELKQLSAIRDHDVVFEKTDKLIIGDFSGHTLITAEKESDLLSRISFLGVEVSAIIYDILPKTHPQFFTEYVKSVFTEWLEIITKNTTRFFPISETTAAELCNYLKSELQENFNHSSISVLPLGSSFSSHEISVESRTKESAIKFLMVGTIEPRKGYLEVLEVFEGLLQLGLNVQLTIVGREGWIGVPPKERMDIVATLMKIKNMQTRKLPIFWESKTSDEALSSLYQKSDFLIAASYAEGFGLPLIEASVFNLPVIARRIEIFEEVMGSSAEFFSNVPGFTLMEIIKKISVEEYSRVKSTKEINVKTWNEVACFFAEMIVRANQK
jgi:glycosyltransferase involved in cell wall biosynthesis